ncbi:low temperature requirement protein A [Kocuria marina]|uniref:low temperature requirement protein A n=1 Tax=Kocuria marina TaxID=223184 RepID=UPI0038CDB533
MGNLELFVDLVFVYASSQLTELVRDDVSWRGFGHGVLGLLTVWWAWVCHNWLTHTFTTTRVVFRCLVIAPMAAMLLAASALPIAFSTGASSSGLPCSPSASSTWSCSWWPPPTTTNISVQAYCGWPRACSSDQS